MDSNKDAASFRNLTATGAITGGSFVIGSADMSEADLEQLDGITAGTAAASKAVVLDASKNIATIGTIGCGAITSAGNPAFAQVTTSGRVIVDDTTEATSATDGSLQTDGGLSVAKSAVIGDDLDLLSNSAVFKVGSDQPFTLTHSNANNTLLATSGHRLAFGDAGEYISGDGTDLKIVSSNDIDVTGDLDVTGMVTSTLGATLASSSGVVTMGATTGATVSAVGILNVNNATEATSATDGSLQTDGGLSVVKSAVIGDDLDLLSDGAIMNIGSTSKFTLTDQSANNAVMASANHRLAFGNAGEYISGDGTDMKIMSSGDIDMTATLVDITGALTVSGNLTVNGTTTTVNSTTVTVDDPIMTLGGDSAPGSDDNKDRGVEFRYHDGSSARVGFMGWDDSAEGFALLSAATNTSEVFSGTAAPLTIGALTSAAIGASTGTFSGVLKTDDTTEATSTTDGSLQTDGGLSVAKSAVIGDDLDLLSNGAIFNVGSAQPFTLTHSNANNTLLATADHRLAFGDAGEYISGDGTDLKIVSSNDIDVTGDLNVVGEVTSTKLTTLASAEGITTIGSSTAATFSAAGLLNVNNATEATSTTDGSLQTDGGLSVVKDGIFGNDVKLKSDAAILAFGDGSDVTLTHVADTALLLNSSRQLQFGDSGTYIHQSSDGILKAVSDDNLVLQAGSSNGDYVALSALTCSFGTANTASPAMLFSGSAANVGMFKWLGSADKFSFMDDISMSSTESIQFRASGNKIHSSTADQLDITSPTVNIDASSNLYLKSDSITFGENGDTDVVLNFNANTSDGVLTWMEDEDYFKFSDDVLMNSDEKIQFAGTGNYVHQRAANVLEVKAPTVEIDGATAIDLQTDALSIGEGSGDVALTFNAGNDGTLTWDTSASTFDFGDHITMADDKKLSFGNAGTSDAYIGWDQSTYSGALVMASDATVYLTAPSMATTKPELAIEGGYAGSGGGFLTFMKHREGSLATDGDVVGGIAWQDGSGTHDQTFAEIYSTATDASGEEGSLSVQCRINSANVEVARFGYKSGSTRYGIYMLNSADHGTIKAHSFITYSDETLKDNITPIDSGLDKVMALQGVTYDWKEDGTADIGFIAQDVEKIVPQAVYGNEDGDYGLDYGSLTSVLVEAVKEQQAQIEELKAELKNKANK